MSWFTVERGGAELRGLDDGLGMPAIFQHGLGGDERQVAEVFPTLEGFRRLTLECRGQGRSAQGDASGLSIASFTDDVLAFADQRGVGRFVAGGISMGAAIALRLAVRAPERVAALILARPAWLWEAAPPNMLPYAEVARHLRNPDKRQALADFESSPTAGRLAREAPDNLDSLKRFFEASDRPAIASLLSAIAADGPGVSEADVRTIAVPTLVLGHGVDLAHPLDIAKRIAASIPGAEFVEITPKATDKARHIAEFRAALSKFLTGLAPIQGSQP